MENVNGVIPKELHGVVSITINGKTVFDRESFSKEQLIETRVQELNTFLEKNGLWKPLLKLIDERGEKAVINDIVEKIKASGILNKEVQPWKI